MTVVDPPGIPPSATDYELLEKCFISRELAHAAQIRRVTDLEGRELVGANTRRGNFAGLAFPYFHPQGGHVRAYRLRRDYPDLLERDGKTIEKAKYLSAPGAGNYLYSPPGTQADWFKDPTLPIVICEGEKKTLALWRIAWHGLGDSAERPRFLPVGLSGVWSWRGWIGKTTAAVGG